MKRTEELYIDQLIKQVLQKIKEDFSGNDYYNVKNTISNDAKSDKIKSFQQYYFSILQEEESYLQSSDFFNKFKKHYSLQGIDKNCLQGFEDSKQEILDKIKREDLASLYFERFHKVTVKYGQDNFREKSLGSFFTKLVHTFLPEKYCALDNPIRNYFGLSSESFFISFIVISSAYAEWAQANSTLLIELRNELKKIDSSYEKATDLKLLDLIYWNKANLKTNSSDMQES